jgi:hypothetical protein
VELDRIRSLAGIPTEDTGELNVYNEYNIYNVDDEITVTGDDTGEYYNQTGIVDYIGNGYIIVTLHGGGKVEFTPDEITTNDDVIDIVADDEMFEDDESIDKRPDQSNIDYVKAQLQDIADELKTMGKPNRARALERLVTQLEKN